MAPNLKNVLTEHCSNTFFANKNIAYISIHFKMAPNIKKAQILFVQIRNGTQLKKWCWHFCSNEHWPDTFFANKNGAYISVHFKMTVTLKWP